MSDLKEPLIHDLDTLEVKFIQSLTTYKAKIAKANQTQLETSEKLQAIYSDYQTLLVKYNNEQKITRFLKRTTFTLAVVIGTLLALAYGYIK